MQDWDTAVKYSTKLIDSEAFALASARTYVTSTQTLLDYMWTNDTSYENIWRIGYTQTSYGSPQGSVFLHFTTDYTYYYPDYVPAQWVLNLYQSADRRYSAYFAELQTGYSHQLSWPLLVKYYGNETLISLLVYHVNMPKPLRLAEQYLIRAEAYCRKGSYSAASADLTKLRESRFVNGGSVSVNAGNWLGLFRMSACANSIWKASDSMTSSVGERASSVLLRRILRRKAVLLRLQRIILCSYGRYLSTSSRLRDQASSLMKATDKRYAYEEYFQIYYNCCSDRRVILRLS